MELWLRTYELSAGGAGWNPKLHPALLHVLADRFPAAQDQSNDTPSRADNASL